MIRYTEGLHLLFKLKGSVIPTAVLCSLPSVILAFLLIALQQNAEDEFTSTNIAGDLSKSQVWSAMTVTLTTLISFRTRQALGRFWEGTGLIHQMRGEWFDSVSCLLSFSRHALATKHEEVMQFRHTLVRLTSLMHGSALDEISGSKDDSYQTIDVMSLDSATLRILRDCKLKYDWNKVCALQHMIQVLITHNLRIGVLDIPPPILSRVYQTLSRGFVNLLNAVKIKDTNFPFPWAQIIMLLLVVHSVFTPCVVTSFMTSYQWAIPVTFVPVFGMFALNQVAAQLEMPFGQDDNDLPLEHFQKEMNLSLLQLLHEMSDHLPSIKPNAKTHIDELRCFVVPGPGCGVMKKSDSKVFETLSLEEDGEVEASLCVPEKKLEEALPTPSEDMGEIKDDLPSLRVLEEKATLHPEELKLGVAEPEATVYALAAQHVGEIAKSTEALMALGQSLPMALRQHSEAMSRFTESVPQILARMASSEQLTSTTEGS
ncbi:unnamed protein product [Symbiodinium natans]|uniref:Uncharacterized protein n=1 Tax=Symbiodinium natans TaxID=878477 RepID=A0A812Q251_9DINO|nr:unnamed protein product [Symbiodinium natans]